MKWPDNPEKEELKMRKFVFIFFVLIFLLFIPSFATAANHYIREGGSGNGSAWDNAWDDLPSTFVRGDTYYVADGVYDGHTFSTLTFGTTKIYIKKATTSDHGTETGWNSSYGNGVAKFEGVIQFSSSYWEFDGQVGGGPGSWDSGHGFEIETPWSSSQTSGRAVYFTNRHTTSHITISHVEIHPQVDFQGYGHLFYGNTASESHITIDHCYLHDNYGCFVLMRSWSNAIFEYNFFDHNRSSSSYHAEAVSDSGSDYVTFRYNYFRNIDGNVIVSLEHAGLSLNDYDQKNCTQKLH